MRDQSDCLWQGGCVSREVALLQWRLEHLSPEDRDKEVQAIQEKRSTTLQPATAVRLPTILAEINAEFDMPPVLN
jgi:hypothetical protein